MNTSAGAGGRQGSGGSVELVLGPDRSLLRLEGVVDAELNQELAGAFLTAARRGLPAEVDARGTTFVDSTLIGAIAHLAHQLPAEVTVVDPPEQVRFLLQVSEVEQLVTVLDARIAVADDVPDDAARVVEELSSPAPVELPAPGQLVEDGSDLTVG